LQMHVEISFYIENFQTSLKKKVSFPRKKKSMSRL